MLAHSNPNNPTGGMIPKSDIQRIVDIASARSIYVLSDEVYRPLFHSIDKEDPELPPSLIQTGYKRAIVTGSMSKTFSLAGIRLGWIASLDSESIHKCFQARDYTTISVSLISDSIATYALSAGTVDNLLNRNMKLAQKNVQIMDDFVKQFPGKVSWIRPKAGTCAFVRFFKDGQPVEDDKFCVDVTNKTGVYFVPGQICFGNNVDFKGFVRIGYVCETDVLVKALELLKGYLESEF
jgi:aspartate/methionine/tyrosine aminotransferase